MARGGRPPRTTTAPGRSAVRGRRTYAAGGCSGAPVGDGGGPDVAQGDGLAGVGGVPHLPVARVDAHVVGRRAEEHEVAGLGARDRGGELALLLRGAREADPDLTEDVLGVARAVEAGRRAGAAVVVHDARVLGGDAQDTAGGGLGRGQRGPLDGAAGCLLGAHRGRRGGGGRLGLRLRLGGGAEADDAERGLRRGGGCGRLHRCRHGGRGGGAGRGLLGGGGGLRGDREGCDETAGGGEDGRGLDRWLGALRRDAGQLGKGIETTWRAVTASSVICHGGEPPTPTRSAVGFGWRLVHPALTSAARTSAAGARVGASPQGASEDAPQLGPPLLPAVCVYRTLGGDRTRRSAPSQPPQGRRGRRLPYTGRAPKVTLGSRRVHARPRKWSQPAQNRP